MNKLQAIAKPTLLILILWRVSLAIVARIAGLIIALRDGFLGPVPWANLDGVHYLSIAKNGYHIHQQAFFPLYPRLIRFLTELVPLSRVEAGLVLSHMSALVLAMLFGLLAREERKQDWIWALVFLFIYPFSFFFAAVYTESLFLMLAVACVYSAKRGKYALSAIFGALASATRLFGVFLLAYVLIDYIRDLGKSKVRWRDLGFIFIIPMGLVWYMWFLDISVGDPLAFIHAQPAFGAGRTGGELILLPQVAWRYLKILLSWDIWSFSYYVAIVEALVFMGALWTLWVGYQRKLISMGALVYSGLVLITPTLSGTLSSIPRYVLSAFPLFFVLGSVHNKAVRWGLIGICSILLPVATALYIQGYFVS